MEKIIGLGGIFIKARDPAALAQWYQQHLGLDTQDFGGPFGAVLKFQTTEPGYQLWSVFPEASDYYPGAAMVNFRVRDLHAMLKQLRAADVSVADKVEESEYGKFGWINDPEGNRVELWEPPPA